MRAFLFGIGLAAPNYYPNLVRRINPELGKMTRNEFSHFKHGDLFLATENGFQFVVRIDIAFVCFILQLVLFDVFPDFFGHFSTRCRSGTDDCS